MRRNLMHNWFDATFLFIQLFIPFLLKLFWVFTRCIEGVEIMYVRIINYDFYLLINSKLPFISVCEFVITLKTFYTSKTI